MLLRRFFSLAGLVLCAPFAPAATITSVTQNSVPNLDPIAPRVEPAPLGNESFAFVDRTHELTSARYVPGSGLLTTDVGGALAGFPSYLVGARYVANANDNRGAGTSSAQNDYRVTYTLDGPGKAYLLLDNRLDGTGSTWSHPNTSDPDLGGNLAWVLAGGWTRVNTGMMPNGQADYIGIDEGGTVNGPDDRTHHDPGDGVGLNNFYSIYEKDVDGSFVTEGVKQATGSGNMYIVAFQPVPEPSTLALVGLGLIGGAIFLRRRKA